MCSLLQGWGRLAQPNRSMVNPKQVLARRTDNAWQHLHKYNTFWNRWSTQAEVYRAWRRLRHCLCTGIRRAIKNYRNILRGHQGRWLWLAGHVALKVYTILHQADRALVLFRMDCICAPACWRSWQSLSLFRPDSSKTVWGAESICRLKQMSTRCTHREGWSDAGQISIQTLR